VVAEQIDFPVDVMAVARRVTTGLHVPSELREDVTQQAVLYSIDLLRRFHPAEDVNRTAPRVQAEKYLAVSLRWHLRTYLRSMRSPLRIPDGDRRLARDYQRLLTNEGPQPLPEAARRLGVRPMRLVAAINAKETTLSLQRPIHDDDGCTLAETVAGNDLSPEDSVVAAEERKHRGDRQTLVSQAMKEDHGDANSRRCRQVRKLVYGFLGRLTYGDAETIRLSFALPSEDLRAVRACRAYGCRQETAHEHTTDDVSRWLGCGENVVTDRRQFAMDEFRDLLGGRDPLRLLRIVSTGCRLVAPTAPSPRARRQG